jgi:hypothetical protein
MLRLRVGLPVVAALLLACGWLSGQDAKTKEDVKEPIVIKGNLPKNWRKLGLSDDQTKKAIRIRAKYAAQLQDLQKQIDELRRQERGELEKVLTEGQRARLKELSDNSRKETK